MSRFFRIEGEDLLAIVEQGRERNQEVKAARKAFLEAWNGGEGYEYMGDRITGIPDPRCCEPPKQLPKGWRKSKQNDGFVCPSSKENQDALWALVKNGFRAIEREIANRIIAQGCEISFGWSDKSHTGWSFKAEGHKVGWMKVYDLEDLGVIVQVPDPTLAYPSIPGCTEIQEYQLRQLFAEANARANNDSLEEK